MTRWFYIQRNLLDQCIQKNYDLSNLPNGVYNVEINGETKIKSIPFKVTNQKVEFDYDNSKVYFKPYIEYLKL